MSAVLELTFLGTGSAYPSPHRGASCTVLRSDCGLWMFDCGEGSQTQLMRSSLRPSRLSKIFITHLHGDHLFGLPGLLCTISQSCSEERAPLEIFGPLGLKKFLRTSLHLSRSILNYKIAVHELCHGRRPEEIDGIDGWSPSYTAEGTPHPQELSGRQIHPDQDGHWDVCQDGPFCVWAAPLKHRVMCFGYVVVENPHPGKLLVDKLKALGVPPGPVYSQLKRGEVVTTEDGRTISPAEVVSPQRPGRKLVLLGDTADSTAIVALAMGADVVVHEATNECAHEEKARANGHSTPGMAVEFCRQVGGKTLLLTHFSQRYLTEEQEVGEREESVVKLEEEGREAARDSDITVELAKDFKMFKIPINKTKN